MAQASEHVATAAHHRLSTDVVRFWNAEQVDRVSRLCGCAAATERDALLEGFHHVGVDADLDVGALDVDRPGPGCGFGQADADQAECYGVDVDSEPPPFLGQYACHPVDPGFGCAVADLARIAAYPGQRGDVDDLAKDFLPVGCLGLAGLPNEVGCRPQDSERRGHVDIDHRVPLFVGGLLYHVVPGVSGVVDD